MAPHVTQGSSSPSARRGFPSLSQLREALGVLVPAIKRGAVPPPPTRLWTGHHGFPVTEPVLAVQTLARRIADVYGLEIGTVVVTFVDGMKVAGRVELAGPRQQDFFVEVNSAFKARPVVLSAILGHEVGHIFLHKHGLHPPGPVGEIFTDTVAVLYGFGAVMAETFRVTVSTEALNTVVGSTIRTTTHTEQLGYLTPDEVGYAATRSGFGELQGLQSLAARGAITSGRRKARAELSTPPLRHAPWHRRVLYLFRRSVALRLRAPRELRVGDTFTFLDGRVVFRCVLCCQALRVPTNASLQVTCPRCGLEMPCLT
jgi:hypothetical protein